MPFEEIVRLPTPLSRLKIGVPPDSAASASETFDALIVVVVAPFDVDRSKVKLPPSCWPSTVKVVPVAAIRKYGAATVVSTDNVKVPVPREMPGRLS